MHTIGRTIDVDKLSLDGVCCRFTKVIEPSMRMLEKPIVLATRNG